MVGNIFNTNTQDKLSIIMWWYCVSAITSAIPIPFIKNYTKSKAIIWIILAILSYCLLIYSYTQILHEENISIIYPTLKIVSIIIVISAGIIFFNDKLNLRSIYMLS